MADVENKQVKKSRRDALLDRLKSKHPDRDFSDDESVFGQISDDFDEYDRNIADMQKQEKAFSDMFTSDPRSAAFLANWSEGQDPVVGLVRQFGTDIKEALEDPERQESIAAANKEFVERVAKEKELEELYQQNLDGSLKSIEALQQESGVSDEDIDKAMELLIAIMKDGIVGIFKPESIQMALKAINHDADVANANQEGLVQGRNTKAEEKLRKPKRGDGMPALGGKNNGGKAQPTRPSLGALESFGSGNSTIWERGNEKRTRAKE